MLKKKGCQKKLTPKPREIYELVLFASGLFATSNSGPHVDFGPAHWQSNLGFDRHNTSNHEFSLFLFLPQLEMGKTRAWPSRQGLVQAVQCA